MVSSTSSTQTRWQMEIICSTPNPIWCWEVCNSWSVAFIRVSWGETYFPSKKMELWCNSLERDASSWMCTSWTQHITRKIGTCYDWLQSLSYRTQWVALLKQSGSSACLTLIKWVRRIIRSRYPYEAHVTAGIVSGNIMWLLALTSFCQISWGFGY